MERPIEMVVAVAENGVIGRDGDLPWRLSGDLRHFKRLTSGHTLLMGRRTWESLPGKLPKRRHLVLSRREVSEDAELPDGVHLARSLAEALEIFRRAARDDERLFAIGGAGIYAQVWDLSSHLHLTRVHAEPPGDTYFPALDLRDWFKQSTERHEAGPTGPGRRGRNDHAFTVEHWTRDPDADEEAASRHEVLRCEEVGWEPLRELLAEFDLTLDVRPPGRPIPATFWGEPEAGLRGDTVYARDDTPLHSLLHEACHAVLAGEERRTTLDVDAGGDPLEEDAVCVLQMLLADRLAGRARNVTRERVAADMDAWGYSFLAGSADDFFRRDSEAARELLWERLGPEWEAKLSL